MRPRLNLLAFVLCLTALSACVGVSKQELRLLGSTATPAKIDFVELTAYATRAKTAYAAEAVIRDRYPNTVRVASPDKTDTQYFVERDDAAKTQYIAIRGTANRRNVLEDVEMRIREDLSLAIPVHKGFDQTAQAIHKDMQPHLRPGYRTYITGHSLGGAIAALLAIELTQDGYDVARVVTFGQPKFTTSSGVERLRFLAITRVVDENDIVPMLPPTSLIHASHGAYEHVGPEVILLDGPHYVFLPAHDADRISLGELSRSLKFADFRDHHMDDYLRRLAAKADGATEVTYNDREKYIVPARRAHTD